MKKYYDYIFFCLYNSMYFDGKSKRKNVEWNAIGMIMGGTFFWLIIPIEIFYFYILNENMPKSSYFQNALIALILFVPHYWMFLKDKKYEKIYQTFKHDDLKKRRREKFIALSYFLIPAIISMLIALRWHHKI